MEMAVSEDQLFRVNDSWVPAWELQPGDEFVTRDGKTAVVQNISAVSGPSLGSCHGLEADYPHDFFANGVLVHDGTARAFALNSAPADTSGPLVAFFLRLRAAIQRLRE